MRKLKDPKMPHGITQISTDFIRHNLCLLDEVRTVRITYDGELDLHTEVIDKFGDRLITDGFSVGYSGEGPTGLLRLLEDLGMDIDKRPSDVSLEVGMSFKWSKV